MVTTASKNIDVFNKVPDIFSRMNEFGIGWDSMFKDVGHFHTGNYPPYNLIQEEDDNFTLELAVAGFAEKDLNIEVKDKKLTISGTSTQTLEEDTRIYHKRGIGGRSFTREFIMGPHVRVESADLVNGILIIKCKRELPPEKRAKQIPIGSKLLNEEKSNEEST
jgi:molecular chaperone IbpA